MSDSLKKSIGVHRHSILRMMSEMPNKHCFSRWWAISITVPESCSYCFSLPHLPAVKKSCQCLSLTSASYDEATKGKCVCP
jgi:hypothetical protein